MNQQKISRMLKLLGLFLLLYFLVHHFIFNGSSKTQNDNIPIVVTANPISQPLSEYITQTGNTIAYNSVDLVARVQGYLEKVQFKDGSFVDKDQPLFVIEPEPYLQKLKEAQASVESAKAGLEYATSEYKRQQRMLRDNATSQNSVEVWRAKQEQAQADLNKATSNVINAKINYSYTHVLSPFKGRIGRHLVDPGNLVGNGQATKLATVEQISPIYVYFNLNELDLFKLRKAAKAAGIDKNNVSKVPVSVSLQDDKTFPFKGHLNFVNTGLNSSTGTLELRALLENKNLELVPGLFVRTRIAITPEKPYLTIPSSAVMFDQIGPYVLTLNEKNIVVLQRIETGPQELGRLAVVKGIKATDKIIVSGLQFATPGQPARTKEATKK
jgi:RND family efflux transporter MFP subunit